MTPLHRLQRAVLRRCHVPRDLDAVTSVGFEEPDGADVPGFAAERIWQRTRALYQSGMYPALQLCVRRGGVVLLDRAIGFARGAGPDDPPDAERDLATTRTPFQIFSAAKPLTAMLIHKLDEEGTLHIEDRVCEYIPEFARHGKEGVTLRHLLAHRAGIPSIPAEHVDIDLLTDPARILELLCDARPSTRPGRRLAYHALTAGFVLGEVVRRVTGERLRDAFERRIRAPLGVRWLRYGARRGDLLRVAHSAYTGGPAARLLGRAVRPVLGVDLEQAARISNDPRFLGAEIPAGNVIGTATDVSRFYQCLLDGGIANGRRIFEARTLRRATSEQSFRELDLSIGIPLRHSAGFMLGDGRFSLFGRDSERAFGHVGLTNTFTWADPERDLSVALLTNGLPLVGAHVPPLIQWLGEICSSLPRTKPALPRPTRRAA